MMNDWSTWRKSALFAYLNASNRDPRGSLDRFGFESTRFGRVLILETLLNRDDLISRVASREIKLPAR